MISIKSVILSHVSVILSCVWMTIWRERNREGRDMERGRGGGKERWEWVGLLVRILCPHSKENHKDPSKFQQLQKLFSLDNSYMDIRSFSVHIHIHTQTCPLLNNIIIITIPTK